MTSIAENIDRILANIRQFELEYHRPKNSVSLLAVSKRHGIQSIEAAARHGLRDFGENYLQEALEKIQTLKHLGLNWHFIGPVQSNKTRGIAENFQWIHSVDREKIAHRLSEYRPAELPPLNVCIQVNLSNENTKSGTQLHSSNNLCGLVADLPGLTLRGLMAIPAPETDFTAQRASFRQLAAQFALLAKEYPTMDTLSMGMTGDFQAAIAEGSTMIRVGTALFGARPD